MYLYKLKDYPFAFDLQCQSFFYISLLSLEFSDPLNENNLPKSDIKIFI